MHSELHNQIMNSPYKCQTTIVRKVAYEIARLTYYARNVWGEGERVERKIGGHDKLTLYGVNDGGNNVPVVEYTLYHTSLVMIIGTYIYVNDSDNFSFSGSATTRNRRVCIPKCLMTYDSLYTEILSYEHLPAAY